MCKCLKDAGVGALDFPGICSWAAPQTWLRCHEHRLVVPMEQFSPWWALPDQSPLPAFSYVLLNKFCSGGRGISLTPLVALSQQPSVQEVNKNDSRRLAQPQAWLPHLGNSSSSCFSRTQQATLCSCFPHLGGAGAILPLQELTRDRGACFLLRFPFLIF